MDKGHQHVYFTVISISLCIVIEFQSIRETCLLDTKQTVKQHARNGS